MIRQLAISLCIWSVAVPSATAWQADPSIEPSPAETVMRWTGPEAGDALYQLSAAIASADTHGLDPWDYNLLQLAFISPDIANPAADRIATSAYLDLANDLLRGRIPAGSAVRWPFEPRERDLNAWLAGALESGDIAASLDALAPRHADYQALRQALARYQAMDPTGLADPIGTGEALGLGDVGPRVAVLRARLDALGYLEVSEAGTEEGSPPDIFDETLEAALKQAQRDAHLEADGVAGAETIAWLETPIARRIAELRINLERWRWLPDDLGAHHIRVNLPDYRLGVFENDRQIESHDVIIGRPSRASPVLTATLTHIIANPWWETPHSLAVRDELPLFRRDPNAVNRLGFQVIDRATGTVVDASQIDWHAVSASDFPYRLRQAPGPLNALGRVKLIFPNPHNTYLHDTPARALFDRSARAFSSGCVRVHEPVDLAIWGAQAGAGLPAETFQAAIDSGRETRIDLDRPIQVHFLYFTAIADGADTVRFVPDIYGHDAAVLAALTAPRSSGAESGAPTSGMAVEATMGECPVRL